MELWLQSVLAAKRRGLIENAGISRFQHQLRILPSTGATLLIDEAKCPPERFGAPWGAFQLDPRRPFRQEHPNDVRGKVAAQTATAIPGPNFEDVNLRAAPAEREDREPSDRRAGAQAHHLAASGGLPNY